MSESPASRTVAAVILAQEAPRPGVLEAMSAAARAVGAHPVVVVLARGAAPPADVRVASVAEGATPLGAMRAGIALLANTPARLVLVWPAAGGEPPDGADALHALVDAARREGAALTSLAGRDPDRSPIIVERDALIDLLATGQSADVARGGWYELEDPDQVT